jgi:DNA-binding response OmpR family regulator
MKILVADDNPVFQNVLKGMLTSWGYEVTTASDGLEAWDLLQAGNGARLAILDWMMPGMEGVEVCRRVRASSFSRDAYLLILTAKARNEDLTGAMNAGADDYITKPFKSVELRIRLRTGCRILHLQEELQQIPKGAHESRVQPALSQENWTLPEAFRELAADEGMGFVGEIIRVFERDTEARIRQVRSALVEADIARLQAEIHSMKGSARQVGADVLATACQELESAAGVAPMSYLANRFAEVEAQYGAVCRAMGPYRDGFESPRRSNGETADTLV